MFLKKTLVELYKYSFVGLFGGILNLTLLYIFTSLVGIHYMYSAVISFFIVNTAKFGVDKVWAFHEKLSYHFFKEGGEFMSVAILGLVGNLILLYSLTEVLGLFYLFSQGISIILMGGLTFFLNITWTFKHKKKRRR